MADKTIDITVTGLAGFTKRLHEEVERMMRDGIAQAFAIPESRLDLSMTSIKAADIKQAWLNLNSHYGAYPIEDPNDLSFEYNRYDYINVVGPGQNRRLCRPSLSSMYLANPNDPTSLLINANMANVTFKTSEQIIAKKIDTVYPKSPGAFSVGGQWMARDGSSMLPDGALFVVGASTQNKNRKVCGLYMADSKQSVDNLYGISGTINNAKVVIGYETMMMNAAMIRGLETQVATVTLGQDSAEVRKNLHNPFYACAMQAAIQQTPQNQIFIEMADNPDYLKWQSKQAAPALSANVTPLSNSLNTLSGIGSAWVTKQSPVASRTPVNQKDNARSNFNELSDEDREKLPELPGGWEWSGVIGGIYFVSKGWGSNAEFTTVNALIGEIGNMDPDERKKLGKIMTEQADMLRGMASVLSVTAKVADPDSNYEIFQ